MPSVKATFGAFAVTIAAGCAQLPERIESLEQAREAVSEIEQDPLARDVSQSRYERARSALASAEELYEENEDLELIEHEAYVALRNAQIVEQQTAERRAREELEQGEAERNRVLLEAREREAERAVEVAEQRGQALAEREQELEQRAQQADEAEQRAEQLEQQLAELEAQETERGWVMTLSDVLFDFDRAELNPGAAQTLDRLAGFLMQNPDRSIVIEGHTDSRGAAAYNRELSRERAAAVRDALLARGVEGGRIELRPLGEEFPVATNDTTAGRQLNRRVEIVLSDETGRFAGEQRTATAEPTEQQE